jgi:hypothetical protein
MNLVTFGDSVAWGLGLKRVDKYATRVATKLRDSNRGAPVMTLNLANPARRSDGGCRAEAASLSLDTRGTNS